MTFYEKSRVNSVCNAFVRWNGWGPPSSEFQIQEFCKNKAIDDGESRVYNEILTGWMTGEYHFDNPLWLD
jgi:hypothetical protein